MFFTEMPIKKIFRNYSIVILVCILCIIVLSTTCKNEMTYQVYVDHIRTTDSISVMSKGKDIAYEFVKNKIKERKDITGGIERIKFENDLSTYRVEYTYILNKDTLSSGIASEKNIFVVNTWVKINFDYNDGDYIVTPEIVKTSKPVYKHKKDYPDHFTFNPKREYKDTYK